MTVAAERLIGRCFVCKEDVTTSFDYRPEARLCMHGCVSTEWPQTEHEKLVTILPQWNPAAVHPAALVAALPGLRVGHSYDVFARWADSDDDFPATSVPQQIVPDDSVLAAALPYSRDFLASVCNLRCGNAVCYRSRRLQEWVTQECITVLDLSTYLWSRTLKDPRSWAIVNVALERGIRHLSAWTAGNAGLALARVVRACNQYLPHNRRLSVYALYDHMDKSVDESVKSALKSFECQLIAVPSIRKTIFSPNGIFKKVHDMAVGRGFLCEENEYWDVTDGWDAVGMMMYRLLAAQVIRDIQPTHIVAPLGTGNLIIGLLLGLEDCESAGVIPEGNTQVIGVVPAGDNIVRQVARRKETMPRYAPAGAGQPAPVMPKIACTYTPLVACIDKALDSGRLRFVETGKREQELAAEKLLHTGQGRRVLSEPSSMAPFSALPQIADGILRGSVDERVLVVNSGFGVMCRKERELLDKYLSH